MAALRFRRLIALCIGLGLLAVALLACLTILARGSPALRSALPWGEGPAINGTISDLATGEPVPGARVSAGGESTTSDDAGRYRLVVPPGRFHVRIEAPGYTGATVVRQEVGASGAVLPVGLPPLGDDPQTTRAMADRVAARLAGPGALEAAGAGALAATAPVTVVPAVIRVLMPSGEIVPMDTEEYLKGVVPAEMGFLHRRAAEALKAQAIAARTYAAGGCLADSAGDPATCEPGTDANVDTTTRTQVWRPIHYDVTDAAVDATRGQAIRDGGALIRALYFARTVDRTLDSEASPCCGGSRVAYLRSASSPEAFDQRHGHGAGMSQEGAAVLADWGASAQEILEHYYAGCTVSAPVSATATVGAGASATPARGQRTAPAERMTPGGGPYPPIATAVSGSPAAEAPGAYPGPASPVPGATSAAAAPLAAASSIRAGEATFGSASFAAVRGTAHLTATGVGPSGVGMLSLEAPSAEADFPFGAVGVRWRGNVPAGGELALSIRTSDDGAVWSDWQEVLREEDEKEPPPAGEFWSSLLMMGGRFVQVAARLRSAGAEVGAATPELQDVTVHYIDASNGPRAPGLRAAGAGLRIITRAEWGADERLRFDSQGNEIWSPEYITPLAQIVHHTVTGNEPADPAAVVRSIYYYHAVSRGWGDIGYNFLVDHRGNVYEGRYGGGRGGRIVAGGHAREYNAVTIGVSLLGTFTSVAPPAAMEAGLVDILAAKGVTYGIQPFAPVVLLGKSESYSVLGHRDVGQTECPGDGAYNRLPAVRREVTDRMSGMPAPVPPTSTRPPTVPPPPTAPPPTATPLPSATARPTVPSPTATATYGPECADEIEDGGFEAESARWLLQGAFRTYYDAHAGDASLFLGLRPGDPDTGTTFATAIQTIRLPERVASARLSFAVRALGDPDDRRVVRILNKDGAAIALGAAAIPVVPPWQTFQFEIGPELAPYAGQEVRVYFAVVNDGDANRTYMRLDDVALVLCQKLGMSTASSATPTIAAGTGGPMTETPEALTATPAVASPGAPATATATPGLICGEWVVDGGFEDELSQAWHLSGGHPARRVSEGQRSGTGALSLGAASTAVLALGDAVDSPAGVLDHAGASPAGVLDYAAASQELDLPLAVVTATLTLWWRAASTSPGDAAVLELREPASGTRFPLSRLPVDARSADWQRAQVSVAPGVLGPRRQLFLALMNRSATHGGGRARILVDDVSLELCYRFVPPRFLPWAERPAP